MDAPSKLCFGDNLRIVRDTTKPMLSEAAAAGFYESKDFPGRYARLQILTIAELLGGKKIEYPAHRVETFAKAERKMKSQQECLFLAGAMRIKLVM